MCGIVTIISKNKLYERLFNKLKKKKIFIGVQTKLVLCLEVTIKYCLEGYQ